MKKCRKQIDWMNEWTKCFYKFCLFVEFDNERWWWWCLRRVFINFQKFFLTNFWWKWERKSVRGERGKNVQNERKNRQILNWCIFCLFWVKNKTKVENDVFLEERKKERFYRYSINETKKMMMIWWIRMG